MIGAASDTRCESGDFEFAALAEAVNYRASLVKEFSPFLRGRVLEVGAGIGQMTALFKRQPNVTELVAVEPDSRFAARFRRAASDVRLLTGTVGTVGADDAWDAIVSINVLEHIEDDNGELNRYSHLLKKRQGNLCLFVPARPEIYSPIDRDFGHFRRYKRAELKEKLLRAGFQIVRLSYFNAIGYFAWWWSFCVMKQRAFNPAAVRLFDRGIFPVTNAIERAWPWKPFGQSLLAIATSA